jgi:hypothetical protein
MTKKSIYIVTTILLFLSSFFCACKDDIVGPSSKNSFASPRFRWKVDTLLRDVNSVVVTDTNSYFSTTNYYSFGLLRYYNNGTISDYNWGYVSTAMDGTDINNLYIGGQKYTNYDDSYPVLAKFSNGSFSQINIKCDTSLDNRIVDIKIINNNVWCGTLRGEIIKYDGTNIIYYNIDTSFGGLACLSTDVYNNIYAYMRKGLSDSLGNTYAIDDNELVLRNDKWISVYKYRDKWDDYIQFYPGTEGRTFCQKYKYNIDYFEVCDFSLGNFARIFDKNSFGIIVFSLGGKSLNDMLLIDEYLNDTSKVFHWNGQVLSNEGINGTLLQLQKTQKIITKNDRYFVHLHHIENTSTFLLKGTPFK